ncbi:hypothetical protein DF049_26240 [Burkholderia cenocepacia]|uniref:hypothetical protein n=1 Tax=Burkholderia cenocepacia TaxID=95486 RepID=UPI000F573E79|nr:hypothetical protein [Burkholderia cenocepacia]RQU73077.1 hypothetical protein DF049_26240 [Burkholderia cenocepacia]RQU88713.1 hypothetical protein DF042_35315 [Burkholderia cenocepacia]HDR9124370.1 hypothetical protein [Burkholderia vietnamiensis]
MTIDYYAIRSALAALDASGSHVASGEGRPQVGEIFSPEQHAGALDPNVTVVLGARGSGKTFWTGVLGNEETRCAAAEAYPNLGLARVNVALGYSGLAHDGSVSKQTIDARVPVGEESTKGVLLWRCVLLRAMQRVLSLDGTDATIGEMMDHYADPELWERDCGKADAAIAERETTLIVLFDALDSLSSDWERLRRLIDSLLEVAWYARSSRSLRVKLFLRPDQMNDLGLRFVELPKMIAGAARLTWAGTDLYGMFFQRLGTSTEAAGRNAFLDLLREESVPPAPDDIGQRRRWPLSRDKNAQVRVFQRLAGLYMGANSKKGRTYDWPLRHLADGHGDVTPRSFLTLMIEAARSSSSPVNQVISAEGIRHGLRQASRVRVDQLDLEFPWIKRVLAPLSRLTVPCSEAAITSRWVETETLEAVEKRASEGNFLPPFKVTDDESQGRDRQLIESLVRIGVLVQRSDYRFDMPDLFRVAARLLKKGGVTPHRPL